MLQDNTLRVVQNELAENKRIGEFVSDMLRQKVYLLPRLDPGNPVEAALRPILHPAGVPEGKNADFYIGGKLFDAKSMMGIKPGDQDKYHNDIINRIKSAKKQADNIVLEIPTFVTKTTINDTVHGYLSQSRKQRIILVKHGERLYVFK